MLEDIDSFNCRILSAIVKHRQLLRSNQPHWRDLPSYSPNVFPLLMSQRLAGQHIRLRLITIPIKPRPNKPRPSTSPNHGDQTTRAEPVHPKRLGTSRIHAFRLRCLKRAHNQHKSCHTSQNTGQHHNFSQSGEPTFPRYYIHKQWSPFPVNRKLKRHNLRLFAPMGVLKRAKAVVGCSDGNNK